VELILEVKQIVAFFGFQLADVLVFVVFCVVCFCFLCRCRWHRERAIG